MEDDINDLFASLGITRDAGRAINPRSTSRPLSQSSAIAGQIQAENVALRAAVSNVNALNKLRIKEIEAVRKEQRAEAKREQEQFQEIQRFTETVQNRVDSRLFDNTSGISRDDRARLTDQNDPAFGLYSGLQLSAAQEELNNIQKTISAKSLTDDGASEADINRQIAAQTAVQLAQQEVNGAIERGYNVPSASQAREMLNAGDGIGSGLARFGRDLAGSAVGFTGDTAELGGALVGGGLQGLGNEIEQNVQGNGLVERAIRGAGSLASGAGALIDRGGELLNQGVFEQGEQFLSEDTAGEALSNLAIQQGIDAFNEARAQGADLSTAAAAAGPALSGLTAQGIAQIAASSGSLIIPGVGPGALVNRGLGAAGRSIAPAAVTAPRVGNVAGPARVALNQAADSRLVTGARDSLGPLIAAGAGDFVQNSDAGDENRLQEAGAAIGGAVTGAATTGVLSRLGLGTLESSGRRTANAASGSTGSVARNLVGNVLGEGIQEGAQVGTQGALADRFDAGETAISSALGGLAGGPLATALDSSAGILNRNTDAGGNAVPDGGADVVDDNVGITADPTLTVDRVPQQPAPQTQIQPQPAQQPAPQQLAQVQINPDTGGVFFDEDQPAPQPVTPGAVTDNIRQALAGVTLPETSPVLGVGELDLSADTDVRITPEKLDLLSNRLSQAQLDLQTSDPVAVTNYVNRLATEFTQEPTALGTILSNDFGTATVTGDLTGTQEIKVDYSPYDDPGSVVQFEGIPKDVMADVAAEAQDTAAQVLDTLVVQRLNPQEIADAASRSRARRDADVPTIQRRDNTDLAIAATRAGDQAAIEQANIADTQRAELEARRVDRQRTAIQNEPLLNLGVAGRNARDLVSAREEAEQVLQELVTTDGVIASERDFYQRLADREQSRAVAAQDRQDALDLGDQIVDRLATETQLQGEADVLLSGLQNAQEALTAYRKLEAGIQQAAAPGVAIQQARQLEQRNERIASALNDFNEDLGITQREERAVDQRNTRVSSALDQFNQDFGQTLRENSQARSAAESGRTTTAGESTRPDTLQPKPVPDTTARDAARDAALASSFEDQAATDQLIGDNVVTGQEANDIAAESLARSRAPVEDILDVTNPEEAAIADAINTDRRRNDLAGDKGNAKPKRKTTKVTPDANVTTDVKKSGQIAIDSAGGISGVDDNNSATTGSIDNTNPLPATVPVDPAEYFDYIQRKMAQSPRPGAKGMARVIPSLIRSGRVKGKSDTDIAQDISDLLGADYDAVFGTPSAQAPVVSSDTGTGPVNTPAEPTATSTNQPAASNTRPVSNDSVAASNSDGIPTPDSLVIVGDADIEDFTKLGINPGQVTSAEVNQVYAGILAIGNRGTNPIQLRISAANNKDGVLPNYAEKPSSSDIDLTGQSASSKTRFLTAVAKAQRYLKDNGFVSEWTRGMPNGGYTTAYLPSTLNTSTALDVLGRVFPSTLGSRKLNTTLQKNGEEVDVVGLLASGRDSDSAAQSGSSEPGEALPLQVGGEVVQDQSPESLEGNREPSPADIDRTVTPPIAKVKFTRDRSKGRDAYYFATRIGNEYVVNNISGSGNRDLGIPQSYTLTNLTTDVVVGDVISLREVRELSAEVAAQEGGQVSLPKNGVAAELQGNIKPHRDAILPSQGDVQRSDKDRMKQMVATQKAVKRMAGRLRGAPVQVFDGVDGLEQQVVELFQNQLGFDFDNRVRGFVFGNTVYVNSEAVTTQEALEETLAHEILGHRGLRAKYGVNLNKELDSIAASLGGISGIVQYATQSGINIDAYSSLIDRARSSGGTLGKAAERDLVEELVALSVGNTIEPRILSQLKLAGAKIRKWLTLVAPKIAEYAGIAMSDVQLMTYAAKAARMPLDADGQKTIQQLADGQYLHAFRKNESVLFEERNSIAENARRLGTQASVQAREAINGGAADSINNMYQASVDATTDYLAQMGKTDKNKPYRDFIRTPETTYNKLVRNMVDDLRVVSVMSADWSRRAIQTKFQKIFKARDAVLDGRNNFVSTSGSESEADQANTALVGYFRQRYGGSGDQFKHFAERSIGLRDIHRSVNPRARIAISNKNADIDVELKGSLDELSRGWSTGAGVLDRDTTMGKVNEWLRVNHTVEVIPELLKDVESGLVSGALSAMRSSSNDTTTQLAKAIKSDISSDPVGAGNRLSGFIMGQLQLLADGKPHDPAVIEFMQNKRPTGLTWFEAQDQLRLLTNGPDQLSVKQIELLDNVNTQLQRKIDLAENQYAADSTPNMARRGQFRGKYHFFPVKKLGEVDVKSFGSNDGLLSDVADIIAPANDRESPVHSINRHVEKAITNHEYGELRDALTLNVMMSKAGETSARHSELTDGVYDGSFIEFVRSDAGASSEERGAYLQAVKESQRRDGATMLLSIPTPEGLVEQLGDSLTYAVRFQSNLPEGRSILALNKSQRSELDQSIKNSDNLLLNASSRGAGFMSGMMTRFSLAHAPVSVIRDTLLGLFSVMANYDNSGRFSQDAGVSFKAWTNAVSDTLQNATSMTRYMHHRSRVGKDPKAEKQIAKLSKLNPTMRHFHEFVESGGLITQLQEITDGNNGARRKITDRMLSVTNADKRDATVEVLGALVSMADVIGRFSTYEAELALGRTPEQARDRSLNIADFGQRGESKAADLGAMLYMFFRSGGVGATQVIDSAFNTPYGKEVGALGLSAGMALFALGALLSPDDENGDNKFLTRQPTANSFTIYNPFTEVPVNVPVPYGHVGMMAHMSFMLMHGLAGGHDSIGATADAMSSVIQRQLLPINTDIPLYDERTGDTQFTKSIADAAVPSVLRPLYRIMTNTNGFGNPITSDSDNPYNSSPGNVGQSSELVSRLFGLDARLTSEVMGSTIPALQDAGDFLVELGNLATGETNFDTVDYKAILYPFNRLVGSPGQSRAQRDYYRGVGRLEDLRRRVSVQAARMGLDNRDSSQRELAINSLNLPMSDRLLLEDFSTFTTAVRDAQAPKRRAQRLDIPLLTDDGGVGDRRAAIDAADEQALQVMDAARQYINRLDATF